MEEARKALDRHAWGEPSRTLPTQVLQKHLETAGRDGASEAGMAAVIVTDGLVKSQLPKQAAHLIREESLPVQRQAAFQP